MNSISGISSEIDKIISDVKKYQVVDLINDDCRIIFKDGPVECPDNTPPFIQSVFKCVAAAVRDYQVNPDKHPKSKPRAAITFAKKFIDFLLNGDLFEQEYPNLVKRYEAYRVNAEGILPSSSGAPYILDMLRDGLALSPEIDSKHLIIIHTILKYTKLSRRNEPKQDTLTGWFEKMPWLQKYVKPEFYKRMGSPKRLMGNLSELVSAALLELDEVFNCLYHIVKDAGITSEDINKEPKYYLTPIYISLLAETIFLPKYDNYSSISKLRELFLADNFIDKYHKVIAEEGREGKYTNSYKGVTDTGGKKRLYPFKKSGYALEHEMFVRFIESAEKGAPTAPNTAFEEYGFRILMAWQTVQPSDIAKLKADNFLRTYNERGVSGIQVQYYKGRAKVEHPTDILTHTSLQGKAIINFVEKCEAQLQKKFIQSPRNNPTNYFFMSRSLPFQFFECLSLPLISDAVRKRLKHSEFVDIVSPLLSAAFLHGSENAKAYIKRAEKEGLKVTQEDYIKAVENPIPQLFFGFSLIKNSSVHAKSDRFREGHLLNMNSHDNATELQSYMTEENRDWLNRLGRLTRLVVDEVVHRSYSLDLDKFSDDLNARISDLESRLSVKPKTQVEGWEDDEVSLPDEIVVIDSPDYIVKMLHFLDQAEKKYKELLTHNPVFLEKEVLPTCEFYEMLLSINLSSSNVERGTAIFERFKSKLPDLFLEQLRG